MCAEKRAVWSLSVTVRTGCWASFHMQYAKIHWPSIVCICLGEEKPASTQARVMPGPPSYASFTSPTGRAFLLL